MILSQFLFDRLLQQRGSSFYLPVRFSFLRSLLSRLYRNECHQNRVTGNSLKINLLLELFLIVLAQSTVVELVFPS